MFQRFLQATMRLFAAYKRRIWNLKGNSKDLLLYSLGGCILKQHLEISSNKNDVSQNIQSIVMNFSWDATQYQSYLLPKWLPVLLWWVEAVWSIFWQPCSHTSTNDFLICFSIVYLMSSFIRYSNDISITPMVKLHKESSLDVYWMSA